MKRAIFPLAAFVLFLLGTPPAHAGCYPYCWPYGDSGPRWSADGSKLAFFRGRATVLHESVVTMNADGSGRREIHAFGWPGLLSPDFGKVAYIEAGPGQAELVVEALDGTGKKALAPAADGLPVWSPDGKRIAFVGPTGSPSWIGSDGTGPVTFPRGRVGG